MSSNRNIYRALERYNASEARPYTKRAVKQLICGDELPKAYKKWANQKDYDNENFKTVSTRINRSMARVFEKMCDSLGTTQYEVMRLLVLLFMVEMRAAEKDKKRK